MVPLTIGEMAETTGRIRFYQETETVTNSTAIEEDFDEATEVSMEEKKVDPLENQGKQTSSHSFYPKTNEQVDHILIIFGLSILIFAINSLINRRKES